MSEGNFGKVFEQKYILASKSQRRINLLKQIRLNFISVDSKIKELDANNHNPIELVKYNSRAKSREVALKFKEGIVIGADTIVVLKKEILNKPKDLKQAAVYLRSLSNKKHIVYTGINILNTNNGKEVFDYEKTDVYFRKLSEDEINYYVKNFRPLDKAGAYGIQDDFGCLFIEKISGDYYNIVGLPLVKLYQNIKNVL